VFLLPLDFESCPSHSLHSVHMHNISPNPFSQQTGREINAIDLTMPWESRSLSQFAQPSLPRGEGDGEGDPDRNMLVPVQGRGEKDDVSDLERRLIQVLMP